MIYKFKTRNRGDVIMTEPVGNQVLQAAGREPAAQGIFEPEAMPAAIAAIEAAIAAEEAARAAAEAEGADLAKHPRGIALRQRAWPLVEMLKRAHADREPVVWGV